MQIIKILTRVLLVLLSNTIGFMAFAIYFHLGFKAGAITSEHGPILAEWLLRPLIWTWVPTAFFSLAYLFMSKGYIRFLFLLMPIIATHGFAIYRIFIEGPPAIGG